MGSVRREDAEEYTEALGQVAAGSFRQIALGMKLGVPQALDLSIPEWVNDRLGGYIKLSIPDRRGAVKELTDPNGGLGLNKSQAAVVLGVDEGTIRNDVRAELSEDSESSARPRHRDSEDSEPKPACNHSCDRHCRSGRGKR